MIKLLIVLYKMIILLLAAFYLVACSMPVQQDNVSLGDALEMINESEKLESSQAGNDEKMRECLESMDFLMNEEPHKYKEFTEKYHEIAEAYRFLNDNNDIMSPDAKEMYKMNLSMKSDMLCAKIKFSSFQLLKEKMK
ncbi:hypothetical protein CWD08_25460 [Salmonella enterica]|nr:hypothetical protein [Salmonella enterica]